MKAAHSRVNLQLATVEHRKFYLILQQSRLIIYCYWYKFRKTRKPLCGRGCKAILQHLSLNDPILADAFRHDEVPYNLVYRVLDSDQALKWKTADGRLIFACTPGWNGWLWISRTLPPADRAVYIRTLIDRLADEPLLPGVTGEPETAEAFAQAYAAEKNLTYRPHMKLESYHCPAVRQPGRTAGGCRLAEARDLETVAAFMAGFSKDAHDVDSDSDSQRQAAAGMIGTGNLYLWEANGAVVSMANIAHRSPRHGRINAVYTPRERRNRGYAGALVATLSEMLLREGLTPMLYTDAANPSSNRAYRKVGFIEMGSILDIRFERTE